MAHHGPFGDGFCVLTPPCLHDLGESLGESVDVSSLLAHVSKGSSLPRYSTGKTVPMEDRARASAETGGDSQHYEELEVAIASGEQVKYYVRREGCAP